MDPLSRLLHRLYGPSLPDGGIYWDDIAKTLVGELLHTLPIELCNLISTYGAAESVACAVTACRLGERWQSRDELEQIKWHRDACNRLSNRAKTLNASSSDVELPESIRVRPALVWNDPVQASIQWKCPNCKLLYSGPCRYHSDALICHTICFSTREWMRPSNSIYYRCTKPSCPFQ